MRPQLLIKIFTVFGIMLVAWFFYRLVKLLLPMLLIAIVFGFLWDWTSKKEDRYDDYKEL